MIWQTRDQLVRALAKHRPGFYLRQKSNYEWEAGWQTSSDGGTSVRADNAAAALKNLQRLIK